MAGIDAEYPKKKVSKILEMNVTGSTTPGEVEDQINPVLAQGFMLINITSFANKIWAVFIKVDE